MRRMRASACGACLVVGLLGSGCAKQAVIGTDVAETTTTSPAGASSTTGARTAPEPEPGTPTTPPDNREVRVVSELTGFTSPTGNIGCYVDAAEARCDIVEHAWAPPPRPADCDLDYGGLGVGPTGPAAFVCAGDTSLDPSNPPLRYGQSVQAGQMRCTSEETGITCLSTGSGHGFTVSRATYRLF